MSSTPSRSPHLPGLLGTGWVRYSESENRPRVRGEKMLNARKFSIFLNAFPFCTESTMCVCSYCSSCCCYGFLITCQTDGLTDRQNPALPSLPLPFLCFPFLPCPALVPTKVKSSGQKPDVCVEVEVDGGIGVGVGFGFLLCG